MKQVILVASLLTVAFSIPFFQVSNAASAAIKHIEEINIELSGDLLKVKSDSPSDPLALLRVYNGANQVVAQTNCSGSNCNLNLSSLAPGLYVAKAWCLSSANTSKSIYVN